MPLSGVKADTLGFVYALFTLGQGKYVVVHSTSPHD